MDWLPIIRESSFSFTFVTLVPFLDGNGVGGSMYFVKNPRLKVLLKLVLKTFKDAQ